MRILQHLYMWVLNPFNITDEKKRHYIVAITCFLLYGLLVLWYSINIFGLSFHLTIMMIAECVLLLLLIIFVKPPDLHEINWKSVFAVSWMLCGLIIFVMGIFYQQNFGYWMVGPVMMLAFPCLYFVMHNNAGAVDVYKLLCRTVVIISVCYFIFCIAAEFFSDSVWDAEMRYNGTTKDANRIGEICVATTVCMIYLLINEKNKLWVWGAVVACSVSVGQTVLTESRSTIIAISLMFIFFIIIEIKEFRWKRDMRVICKMVISIALIVLLSLGVATVTKAAHAWNSGKDSPGYKISHDDSNKSMENNVVAADKSNSSDDLDLNAISSGRIMIWKMYLSNIALKGHVCDGKVPISGELTNVAAHNTILEVSYRSGAIAGILFIIIEFLSGIYLLRVMVRGNEKNKPEDYFIALASIGFIIVSNLQVAYNPLTSIIFFIYAMGAAVLFKKKDPYKRQKNQ